MPRPPLTSKAVDQLAKYFGAISDASFIDRTWQIASFSGNKKNRDLIASGSSRSEQFSYYRQLQESDPGAINGTTTAQHLSELINGCVSFESFLSKNVSFEEYSNEFEFFKCDTDLLTAKDKFHFNKIDSLNASSWNRKESTTYAINVMNPYMGPTTRDTGAVEVFANSIPTIELSKCVPYINIDLISLFKTEKAAPPMSLIGFLNPKSISSVDQSMINAQKTIVRSEAQELGAGYKAGIELFLMPQTLTNQGETGSTYVPVIDRMRPLMSLKNLNLSTKIQGGTLSFTSGKLELVLHDRSRMRDIAPFIRPDLYGTTFLDITYGWSHPEGQSDSKNSFGILLNSLKNETRYRISNATYSFEDGGQVNISLSIQTVGSIDLLFLGPRNNTPKVARLNELFKRLSQRVSELKGKIPVKSMDSYNYILGIEDPYSILKTSFNKEFIKKLSKTRDATKDDTIKEIISEMLGGGNGKNKVAGAIVDAENEIAKSYLELMKEIPTFDDSTQTRTISKNLSKEELNRRLYFDNKKSNESSFFSYGDFFMKFVAAPIVKSGNYDEVQVIFYPFNKYAGAVHDLPISCFPIDKSRFEKMINDLVVSTPEITIRTLLNSVNSRFTGFMADRNYLLADFYDKDAADKGEIKETKQFNQATEVKVAGTEQTTLEQRCSLVGIPELKIKPAVVEIFVEASKLYDIDGNPVIENGKTLSLIKIHVYDAAMDPHGTLADILGSARDNELDLIRIPISDWNATKQTITSAFMKKDISKINPAMRAIMLAEENGLLEAVTINSEITDSPLLGNHLKDLQILRMKGNYEELKKLVSTGMPTITYGSSTSVISNASLSSNSSAGLGNVLMQRAFTEPASTTADNIGTGPPMQVIPATLSITTVGCPLFYPMQRFFVDFGTGTSVDNVYAVINVDNKISKDGFTTDIKFGLADGWAMSRSLNQNLALMLLSLQPETTSPTAINVDQAPLNDESNISRLPTPDEFVIGWFHALLVKALVPVVEVQLEIEERIREEIEKIQLKIAAKIEEQKQKAIQKIEAAIPEAVKKAVETAKEKKVEVDYKIQQAQIIAAKIQYLSALAAMIPEVAAQIGPEAAERLKAETQSALAEARAQAEENRRAENENE